MNLPQKHVGTAAPATAKPRAVGIDLGTSFSAVACVQEDGRTMMILNNDGEILTPSLVLFDDAAIIVGREARRDGAMAAGRLAEWVKRDMGNPVYSRPIRGEYLPPEAIQACILRQLHSDVTRAIKDPFRVVITVPAFFDELRRRATAEAGEMAGLDVLDIVNEPTAAALAFGERLGFLEPGGLSREPLKILVYDLGGGTFDVTLLDMRPREVVTLATDGDVRLGGYDWNLRIVDYAAGRFVAEHRQDPRQDPVSLHQLMQGVEEAKRALTTQQQAHITVTHGNASTQVTVTRDQFEQLTADLLQRTLHTTRQLLNRAGLQWKDINRILLVGGSTRMPMVAKRLEEVSGIPPEHAVHPDEAVARGAALYANFKLTPRSENSQEQAIQITNVNSHSLGVQGTDAATMRAKNKVLIPRNTPLPATVTKQFVTRKDNQQSIVIQVLEGESSLPSACISIGKTVIRGLPPGMPKGTPVKVTYEYGSNGRLLIKAQVPGTDKLAHLELEHEARRSPEQLARWREVLGGNSGLSGMTAVAAQDPGRA